MSTVIGIECSDGAVLAGDRALVRGGSVVGSKQRVFDVGVAGAAVVGESGGIDEFGRRLDVERRKYETDGRTLSIEPLARIVSDLAAELSVEALVAGRDEEGVARIRTVGGDGGTLDDPTAALGTGAELAFGQLEGVDADASLDEAASTARDVMAAVAERDAETGEDVDVYRLSDAE